MSNPADKRCPRCGHRNRMTAKNCTQCGTLFHLVEIDGDLRKRCTNCGTYNRLSANVCTQCGTAYIEPQVMLRGINPKWCPQCGSPRKPSAKVCPYCGYRFASKPSEAPVIQSETLAEPKKVIEPPDLRGEPAPYLSPEELRELRLEGRTRTDFFVRLLQTILGDKS